MPTARIHCVGLNHKTAPVELRELFASPLVDPEQVLFPGMMGVAGGGDAVPGGNGDAQGGCPHHSQARTSGDVIRRSRHNGERRARARRALSRRKHDGAFADVTEATVFATCNRMELYACVNPSVADPLGLLHRLIGVLYDIDTNATAQHFYHFSGMEAVVHLCKVAAGLDSQVLGETQIMGQVRGAYENSLDTIAAGPFVHAVFRAAIRAGKRTRSETMFSRNPASMSSVAISTAQDILGDLHDKRILVVGLGEMGMLTMRALHARQLANVAVANRTIAKAEPLRHHWNVDVYSLDELSVAMSQADVVVSSTAAPGTVIDADAVRTAMNGREDRPLVVVDIAVPRDVDVRVGEVAGVHLVDADALRVALDESLEARKREIPRVEGIIAEEAARCEVELRELSMRPVITELRDKAETIRRLELEKTLRHLPDVDAKTAEQIHYMSRAIVNKLLHEPTVRLKRSARSGRHNQYSTTVRDLFGLPESGES